MLLMLPFSLYLLYNSVCTRCWCFLGEIACCDAFFLFSFAASNWNSGTMGIIERIKEIEAEMARTQKNKATGVCDKFLREIMDWNICCSWHFMPFLLSKWNRFLVIHVSLLALPFTLHCCSKKYTPQSLLTSFINLFTKCS